MSNLSWPIPAAITVAAVVGLLLLLRQWLSALVAALLVAAADGSNYIVSQIVQRPRPSGYGIHVASNIKGFYSFPSGHVAYAVAFFGFLIFLAAAARPRAPWLSAIIALLVAILVLMPISRLLEGEHWLSDVIGALLWGLFWLLGGVQVYRWAWEHLPRMRRHIPDPRSQT